MSFQKKIFFFLMSFTFASHSLADVMLCGGQMCTTVKHNRHCVDDRQFARSYPDKRSQYVENGIRQMAEWDISGMDGRGARHRLFRENIEVSEECRYDIHFLNRSLREQLESGQTIAADNQAGAVSFFVNTVNHLYSGVEERNELKKIIADSLPNRPERRHDFMRLFDLQD